MNSHPQYSTTWAQPKMNRFIRHFWRCPGSPDRTASGWMVCVKSSWLFREWPAKKGNWWGESPCTIYIYIHIIFIYICICIYIIIYIYIYIMYVYLPQNHQWIWFMNGILIFRDWTPKMGEFVSTWGIATRRFRHAACSEAICTWRWRREQYKQLNMLILIYVHVGK